MSDNLKIYEAVRTVPPAALREIQAGRLKGKSDINPMWRIKTLTEQFGPCGFGWRYEITSKGFHEGGKDEVAAFVDINLYVKVGDIWSEAIPGTGGSSFVAQEKNGLYTNDECFKMALTDAISVACKALGVGADVYWNKDSTKYNGTGKADPPPKTDEPPTKPTKDGETPMATEPQVKAITSIAKKAGLAPDALKETLMRKYDVEAPEHLTKKEASEFIGELQKGAA